MIGATAAQAASAGITHDVSDKNARPQAVWPLSGPPLPLAQIQQPTYTPMKLGDTIVKSFRQGLWGYSIRYQYTKTGWRPTSYSASALDPTTLQPLVETSTSPVLQPYGTSQPPKVPLPELPPGPYPPAAPPVAPNPGHPPDVAVSPCGTQIFKGVSIVVKTTYVWVEDEDGEGGHWKKVSQQVKVMGSPSSWSC